MAWKTAGVKGTDSVHDWDSDLVIWIKGGAQCIGMGFYVCR